MPAQNIDLPTLLLTVRAGIACVFVAAALGKLRHLTVFRGVLANYRLLPPWAVGAGHLLLPAAELVVGLGMLAVPRAAGPSAALLLAVFAAAMAINLRRGRRDIDCGCHQSALRQRLSWTLVCRNGVLALLALTAALPQTRPSLGACLVGAAGGISLFMLYSAMNAVWALGSVSRRRIRIAGIST